MSMKSKININEKIISMYKKWFFVMLKAIFFQKNYEILAIIIAIRYSR